MHLISAFEVAADCPVGRKAKGRIISCPPISNPGFSDRLVRHKNFDNFSYEENHLEEWIAREPSAIFDRVPVLLLGSQNYIHFPVKMDLLFVDAQCRLYPVEVKVTPVAKNGGTDPYDLYNRQMKQYAEFLKNIVRLADLNRYYSRFAYVFKGIHAQLEDDFVTVFGRHCDHGTFSVCEVYVAEGYDEYALDYFRRRSKEDQRSITLVSYKFFPAPKYIEFWKVYQTCVEE